MACFPVKCDGNMVAMLWIKLFYLLKQIQYITYFQQAWSIHKELSKCVCVNVPFFSDLPWKLSNHMSMIFVDMWNRHEEWSFWFSAFPYCEHRTIFKWCMLERNSHIINKVFMKKSYTFEGLLQAARVKLLAWH